MASGSYARRPSQKLSSFPEVMQQIPSRATRQLPRETEMIHSEGDTDTSSVQTRTPATKARQGSLAKNQLSPRPNVVAVVSVGQERIGGRRRRSSWVVPWVWSLGGAILFLSILLSAAIFQRPGMNVIYHNGRTYDLQVGGNLAGTWQKGPPQTTITAQTGPYTVLGKPSLTVDFINQVLSAYRSPAANKGQALYDFGVQYGIDPAFALAFFMHESSFGTQGEATKSLSLGNIRCIPNYRCEDNFAQFDSWEAGFEAWYQLIRNLYVAQWGLTTVDAIIPRYAPAADNNNETAYINALKRALDTWHSGQVLVRSGRFQDGKTLIAAQWLQLRWLMQAN
jgi:hypothetical protein